MRGVLYLKTMSVNGLESRQFGGVLRVILLRENDNEVNLEKNRRQERI